MNETIFCVVFVLINSAIIALRKPIAKVWIKDISARRNGSQNLANRILGTSFFSRSDAAIERSIVTTFLWTGLINLFGILLFFFGLLLLRS